jgi:hypothetical protein
MIQDETGVHISWRPRKQWRGKKLTATGPPDKLELALEMADIRKVILHPAT